MSDSETKLLPEKICQSSGKPCQCCKPVCRCQDYRKVILDMVGCEDSIEEFTAIIDFLRGMRNPSNESVIWPSIAAVQLLIETHK